MDHSTSHKVNKAELFQPTFTPYPRGWNWINYGCDVERINDMRSKMSSFSHRWVLDLHTDQTETKRNNPSRIINRFEVLTISFTISNNSSSCLRWNTESNQIEYKVGHAHVNCISIQHKLAIVRTSSRSFDESISNVSDTDPDTANEVQQ